MVTPPEIMSEEKCQERHERHKGVKQHERVITYTCLTCHETEVHRFPIANHTKMINSCEMLTCFCLRCKAPKKFNVTIVHS